MSSTRSKKAGGAAGASIVCAIVAIGRELLLGRTLDTNSHWLADRLTRLGARVERISVIDDRAEAIIAELRDAWRRRLRIIVTTGGLGPSYDDATLAAIAQATRRPLELEARAVEHVRSRYRRLAEQGLLRSGRLTPARKKMALLPRGSGILANPVGVAPGMQLKVRGSLLLCLPGVPAEMRAMFDTSVVPLMLPLLGQQTFLEARLDSGCNDESVISRIVEPLRSRYPAVYFKSDATGFKADGRLTIFLTAWGDDAATVRRRLDAARTALRRALRRAGFSPRA